MTSGVMIDQLRVGGLETNCWIVPLARDFSAPAGGAERPLRGECILIDPGDNGAQILARLDKLLLQPRYVAITHAHFDHVTALPEIAAAYPGAEIAIHRLEAAQLGSQSLPAASALLDDGDKLGPFQILHLPGHSPGSIALYWPEEKVLFSGDTLFDGDVGRSDLPGGSETALAQSLRRLFTLDGDIQVYPGHGPLTTIGREKGRHL